MPGVKPLPKPVADAVDFAVSKSCSAIARKVTQGGLDEVSSRVVKEQLCNNIGLVSKALLSSDKLSVDDVGRMLFQNQVSLFRLTKSQQVLCATALADLGVNGVQYAKEFSATVETTSFAAELGLVLGPETAIAFGGAEFLRNLPGLIGKSTSLVDAAFDAYSQCGPLSFDKTIKPRNPQPAATLSPGRGVNTSAPGDYPNPNDSSPLV